MTTQYERDMLRHEREDRRLFALVDAATDILGHLDDRGCPEHATLTSALSQFSLRSLTQSVARWDEEVARRKRDQDAKDAAKRSFEELPECPPRMQCHAQVARDMGRLTDFSRCENAATRVVLDREARKERVLCTIHAKDWAGRKNVDEGFWYDAPHWLRKPTDPFYTRGNTIETHESWYRGKGWCMEMVNGRYCKVRVDIGSGKHEGDHR